MLLRYSCCCSEGHGLNLSTPAAIDHLASAHAMSSAAAVPTTCIWCGFGLRGWMGSISRSWVVGWSGIPQIMDQACPCGQFSHSPRWQGIPLLGWGEGALLCGSYPSMPAPRCWSLRRGTRAESLLDLELGIKAPVHILPHLLLLCDLVEYLTYEVLVFSSVKWDWGRCLLHYHCDYFSRRRQWMWNPQVNSRLCTYTY